MFVCLYVDEHISGTTGTIFAKFFCACITSGRDLVLLWRRCDMLCTSGFTHDVMSAHNKRVSWPSPCPWRDADVGPVSRQARCQRLCDVLLMASPTQTGPTFTWRWLAESAATLVHAFVTSCVDYCNAVLAGASKSTTDKLQRVLNAAVRVVSDTRKYDRSVLVSYLIAKMVDLLVLHMYNMGIDIVSDQKYQISSTDVTPW